MLHQRHTPHYLHLNFQTISNPMSHEMLLAGLNGAPLLTPDDLAALLALNDAVQVRRRDAATSDDDDDAGLEVTPVDAAENLAALLDASAAKKVKLGK